ncbi:MULTISPECIES: hypothetical protein [Rhodococcus]|uniref:Uncharacterized protein n=1 Tax=Rhodococcus aetherivorans TaxID=191292 RepID=A0AA46SAD8_9NOCA|nr:MULTISPECIES: hypothetical protein [Rhodococcus]UGQ40941.1 hypothetical protein LRQ66_22830 [Rhodococcus aetherivorans]UYF94038.1 hypothetical protein OCS65_27070 [Rhodococcus aetherivorans]
MSELHALGCTGGSRREDQCEQAVAGHRTPDAVEVEIRDVTRLEVVEADGPVCVAVDTDDGTDPGVRGPHTNLVERLLLVQHNPLVDAVDEVGG